VYHEFWNIMPQELCLIDMDNKGSNK